MAKLSKLEFIATLLPHVLRVRKEGSPMFPSVRIAQNLLETGGVIHSWNNLGGIKVGRGKPNAYWRGRMVHKGTWEDYGKGRVNTTAYFRAYDTLYDFYKDQDLLFQKARYARVRVAKTPEEQAEMLRACGYATDPSYASKIRNIVDTFGLKKYDGEGSDLQVYKERIVAVNGRLKYIPLGTGRPYATKATDVRLIRVPKGQARYRFVYEKAAKVSALVKKYGASIGINFPFFYNGVPLGDTEDQDRVISSAYGKMLSWHELASVNGEIRIGQLSKSDKQDFLVQATPLLVEGGKSVWSKYTKIEQTAPDIAYSRCQRTFVGLAANGDFLIAVADGRTRSDQGLTLEEMALYMIDKGAVMALNGDGGGSSILCTSFGGKYLPYIIEFKAGSLNQALNTGSNERSVNHALLVYLN